jgi:hypothetical protein
VFTLDRPSLGLRTRVRVSKRFPYEITAPRGFSHSDDVEPRDAAIPIGSFPVTAGGSGLGKMRQRKAEIKKSEKIIA